MSARGGTPVCAPNAAQDLGRSSAPTVVALSHAMSGAHAAERCAAICDAREPLGGALVVRPPAGDPWVGVNKLTGK